MVGNGSNVVNVVMLTRPERLLRLSGEADHWRTAYRAAKPWPHLVVDDAIELELAAEIAAVAAATPPELLVRESSHRVKKDAAPDVRPLGVNTECLFEELAAPAFLDFLSDLTGVGGLQADPSLHSAGVFITHQGGWQRVHEDFPRHPVTGLWNRVALLLYCSQWSAGWGGELELWPMDMSGKAKIVEPAPGRLVVFDTHRGTRHGVAEVAASAPSPRVVVATRYYSSEPPPHRPSGLLVRSFRRPTERRRDVLPTFAETRSYVTSRFGGNRKLG